MLDLGSLFLTPREFVITDVSPHDEVQPEHIPAYEKGADFEASKKSSIAVTVCGEGVA